MSIKVDIINFVEFHRLFLILKILLLQLEKYMTEDFLKKAFDSMGEDSVVSIKVIKNKFTGELASYGFVHFDSDAAALMAMHKLNNKIIPNSQPVSTFLSLESNFRICLK